MTSKNRSILKKEKFEIPVDWAWYWCDEVFDFQGGSQPPAKTFVSEPREGYVRLVQIRDYYTDEHMTYIPDSPKLKKCSESDLLIARYGASLGRICRGLTGAYNVALAKTIPSPLIEKEYLFYLLNSRMFQVPLLNSGDRSAQAGFNKESISTIPFPLPPLPEQQAIASILGALDDKIDLNRRMNETIESMARAIFKSWFVDFDPVRAKMEGKQPFGMDAETAALFPDRLVESELGLIPEGWDVVAIGTLVELDRTSLKPEEFPETTFLHYSIPAYDSGQSPSLDIGSSIKSSKFVVTDDVVLVSKLNPRTPRVWLPDHDTNQQAICSTEFLVLRPRNIENQMLIYVLCCQSSFRNRLMAVATGTSNSHQRVRPDDILDSKIAFDAEVAEKISCHLSSIATLVLNNRNESRTLAELRDLLLPKLVSGEIRVKEAEQMVEAAV